MLKLKRCLFFENEVESKVIRPTITLLLIELRMQSYQTQPYFYLFIFVLIINSIIL
jgi:hypothetical protein